MFDHQQTDLLTASFTDLLDYHAQFDHPAQTENVEERDSVSSRVWGAITKLYQHRIESLYSRTWNSRWSHAECGPQHESLYNHYHQLLETHLIPVAHPKVLQVGCGSGKFCHTLVERGCQTFGIDLSHALLQEARQIAPGCEFERGSVYESYVDLFLTAFDAIVYLDAIEHLHSPRQFLRRAHESLAPGGLLIVSARYQGRFTSLTSALTGHRECNDPFSNDEPNHQNLGEILQECGFHIEASQGPGCLEDPWRSQLAVGRKAV